ncbi:MAG: glutamate-5-semialdehyde dehydrogenase [Lachnospiraceae bacterium]|nr:glutamate-5-semialdehyde dehydrogenase [Lachnospiraceae bacterium]
MKDSFVEPVEYLEEIGKAAKAAETGLALLSSVRKNEVLCAVADALVSRSEFILEENRTDADDWVRKGKDEGMLDRLLLSEDRIEGMATGLRQVASLEDPIGEVLYMKERPNGLMIGEKRVPLGVIGIIYESRPNVTADAFGLCFKTGNVVILKGGSDAINSNKAIIKVIRDVLESMDIDPNVVSLIESTDREVTKHFMQMNDYIDVLIPRGGAGLIRTVVENSNIPVIETGTGNCHIYVDKFADIDMAINIIFNAKTSRISVCNSCESLVVHKDIEGKLLPALRKRLDEKHVELRGDERAAKTLSGIKSATEEDWGAEYLDYILSIKVVDSIEEAIAHINKYNTGHSDAIVTRDYENAQKFLNEVDAAAVYVNASTRFTDGFEFGLGAEIGISTQKLHARGPMGLKALTTTKFIIYGNGQVRE